MYTIGQISEMFHLPVSTLRYYDKEGLFPHMQRSSGIRKFTDREIETLRVIECLKKSGLEIKHIKQFMEWCAQGSETYGQRLELFQKQKKAVENEIQRLEKTLDMIRFKCWYYEQAIQDGSEDHINEMLPNQLPKDIQILYDRSHEKSDFTLYPSSSLPPDEPRPLSQAQSQQLSEG
ncbi:MAG: MerR family transcriptional regulator [Lachnospiraceae bacterium]|jgi:DNA-binding transcriptional MerR regulator|nr:MerR family transcriptional regulator [Lachnospiraceae bacterium]